MTTPTTSRTRNVNETSSISDFGEERAEAFRRAPLISLSDRRLRHIERIRLLTGPGDTVWDLSYAWGTGTGGKEKFRVDLGRHQFPRKGLTGALINTFKEAGRYGKAMGLFDDNVISKVW